MNCETAMDRISARLDREAGADAELDAHLGECANCRTMADAFSLQDADLRRAFEPRRDAASRVADGVIEKLRDDRQKQRRSWAPMIFAAAAGFMIAMIAFQPWQAPPEENPETDRRIEEAQRAIDDLRKQLATSNGTAQTAKDQIDELAEALAKAKADGDIQIAVLEDRIHKLQSDLATAGVIENPVGHLTLATGLIEVKRPGKDWGVMPTGAALESGTRVRTDESVRCEFRMKDGSDVRLNEKTELVIQDERTYDLKTGEIFTLVAENKEKPFNVGFNEGNVEAIGTAFNVVYSEKETMVTVVEGSTKVRGLVMAKGGGYHEEILKEGERIKITKGLLGKKQAVRDLVNATRWVHEILVLKGKDNPELSQRINDLFAQIGRKKMKYLEEHEIKALGDHCVIPLTRYIQSDDGKMYSNRRRDAARILSDVAVPWSIPYLIELLGDQDGEVRFHISGALYRLTGENLGRTPQGWRDETWSSCETTHSRWKKWWSSNKEKFPGQP